MATILTFDVGTTAIKTCLFSADFQLLTQHSEEYRLLTAPGGVVELEPDTYWQGLCRGARSVLAQQPLAKDSLVAVGITTQGETLVPVDEKGRPVSRAIVWLDSRSVGAAAELRGAFDSAAYYPVTGLGQVDENAPISKLLHLKQASPETYKRVHKFLLLEDYLAFRLTGEFVTEKSLMSSTGYFDIVRDKLFSDILGFAEIPERLFPEILDCGQRVGRLTSEAAEALGLPSSVAVVTGAMDQLTGALGAGNTRAGIVTATTGTALVIGATTTTPNFTHPAKPTIYRHVTAGKYLTVPFCLTAGVLLKWFKDNFCEGEASRFGDEAYNELGRLAQGVPAGSDGLVLFPYFSGMLTPVNDMTTKGMFYGLTLDMKKGHFVRAIFESVAFMLRENVSLLQDMGVKVSQIRSLGGGAKSPVWSQIKADVLGLDLVTMKNPECASLGAAMLAAVGVGLYPSLEDLPSSNPIDWTFTPDPLPKSTYDLRYRTYQKLYDFHRDLSRMTKEGNP